MKKFYLILLAIILVGLALRVYKLESLPALNADEAALGYNAYSLLETGKDEFGDPWPLVFTSFGDYKPGIYVYMTLPFIWLGGLNVWMVRLPAILVSLASIWLVFAIVQELGKRQKFEHGGILGLLMSLGLAISPWHIHFSRGGWETQVATGFVLGGVYLFLKGLKQGQWLIGSALFFVLAIYTYHSMRVVAPLLGLILAIIYWRDVWQKQVKFVIAAAVTGALLLIPFVLQLTSESGLSRAQGVSIFADEGPIWRVNELRSYHDEQSVFVKLLHNKAVVYSLRFAENYVAHFNGNFLFLSGDVIERNRVPEMGQLYLVWWPILLLGLGYALVKKTPGWNLFGAWLLIAPIPAALTFQSPHAVRALSMSVPIAYFVAVGYMSVWAWARQWTVKAASSLLFTILGMLLIWDVSRYLFNYYVLMTAWYPYSSQYGFSELVPWVESVKDEYDEIWITERYDQPYILFLFYSQYPPEQFQSQATLTERDNFGFSTVRNYDHYHFDNLNFEDINKSEGKILVIGTEEEIPGNMNIIKEITSDSGRVIFKAAEVE